MSGRADARTRLLAYHRLSSHAPGRYAPGPGRLDWASQPDPFRRYAGAPRLDLPLPPVPLGTPAAALAGARPPPRRPDRGAVGALLGLSFGLAAWKWWGASRWALRCNPSSGNLHPTEAYVVTAGLPGLPAGTWHYVSLLHALERRAAPARPEALAEAWPGEGVLVGLSSIVWRESWKYGVRAWRYCNHDAGHALAALACAAAALGWRTRLLARLGDDDVAALLGLDRAADLDGAEPEVPDLLAWVGPEAAEPDPAALRAAFAAARPAWHGRASRLSATHIEWPGIAEAEAAARKPRGAAPAAPRPAELPLPAELPGDGVDAAVLFRRRRSAVAFDGRTAMPRAHFLALLDRLLARPSLPPWEALPWAPRVALVLLVHRVEGLAPGVYLLPRGAEMPLPAGEPVPEVPAHLGLARVAAGDVRALARTSSCHQEIAADSCFAAAMLAPLEQALAEGGWWYRWLHWEAGMIGHMLYLGAELAGLRGTGIGCFLDALVPEALGLAPGVADLYHFTVGAGVEDPRLATLPPYAELETLRHEDAARLRGGAGLPRPPGGR